MCYMENVTRYQITSSFVSGNAISSYNGSLPCETCVVKLCCCCYVEWIQAPAVMSHWQLLSHQHKGLPVQWCWPLCCWPLCCLRLAQEGPDLTSIVPKTLKLHSRKIQWRLASSPTYLIAKAVVYNLLVGVWASEVWTGTLYDEDFLVFHNCEWSQLS